MEALLALIVLCPEAWAGSRPQHVQDQDGVEAREPLPRDQSGSPLLILSLDIGSRRIPEDPRSFTVPVRNEKEGAGRNRTEPTIGNLARLGPCIVEEDERISVFLRSYRFQSNVSKIVVIERIETRAPKSPWKTSTPSKEGYDPWKGSLDLPRDVQEITSRCRLASFAEGLQGILYATFYEASLPSETRDSFGIPDVVAPFLSVDLGRKKSLRKVRSKQRKEGDPSMTSIEDRRNERTRVSLRKKERCETERERERHRQRRKRDVGFFSSFSCFQDQTRHPLVRSRWRFPRR